MAEILETKNLNNVSILSNIGWIPALSIHKTIKYEKYIVLFESGNEIECADNHCFIDINYNEIHAKNLIIGDIIISDGGYDIVFDIFNTGILEEMYDVTLPYHHLYYTNGILSHNSNIMTNIVSRQVMNGIKVGLATLEMSEDIYAQRFDANLTNLDINRIYHNQSVRNQFIKNIKDVREKATGSLWIKEYPTGQATVADFRRWLRELKMRGIDIEILFCDYLALMKTEGKSAGDLYRDGKSISEELRAVGFEFGIPIVTVAQINRSGTFLDFESLDMNSIAESFGIGATADSVLIQGSDSDDMIYKNELKWKVVKNRLGGRVGSIGKWYFDSKSLRIYDELEFSKWVDDVSMSGDSRDTVERSVR